MRSTAGEFADRAVEAQFNAAKLANTRRQLFATLLFCSIFYVLFSVTDFGVLGFSRIALGLLLVRVGAAVTAAAACYLVRRHPQSVSMPRLAASLTELVGMGAFFIIVWHRPAEIAWHAMSMALMLIVVYLYIPNRLRYSAAIALFTTVAFIALVLWMDRLQPHEVLTMCMLLLLANAFGFVAARRYQLLWREEFRVQAVFQKLSLHDHLTSCYNRHYLQHEQVEGELARARRSGLPLSVILCDIDHFKAVNDRFGHAGGDRVLVEFARLMRSMTRAGIDSVIRYGGEEFLLIVPETGLDGASQLADRLRAGCAALSMAYDGDELIQATASFGVATVDFSKGDKVRTLRELISVADRQLYLAKDGGRNLVMATQLE